MEKRNPKVKRLDNGFFLVLNLSVDEISRALELLHSELIEKSVITNPDFLPEEDDLEFADPIIYLRKKDYYRWGDGLRCQECGNIYKSNKQYCGFLFSLNDHLNNKLLPLLQSAKGKQK